MLAAKSQSLTMNKALSLESQNAAAATSASLSLSLKTETVAEVDTAETAPSSLLPCRRSRKVVVAAARCCSLSELQLKCADVCWR